MLFMSEERQLQVQLRLEWEKQHLVTQLQVEHLLEVQLAILSMAGQSNLKQLALPASLHFY